MRNELSNEDIVGLLNRTTSGVLSTVGEDGCPYGVPVNHLFADGRIYFHGSAKGEKAANITNRTNVCFTVYEENGIEDYGAQGCKTTTLFESAVIRGKAYAIEDHNEKKRILCSIVDKFAPDKNEIDDEVVRITDVFRIDIASMTGRRRVQREGSTVRPIR